MKHTVNAVSSVFRGQYTADFVYSGAALQADRFADGIYLARANAQECCLKEIPGDYDAVSAVSTDGITYAAVMQYQKGLRRICLLAVEQGKVCYEKQIAGYGKLDGVQMCLHQNRLYLAAEEAHGEFCRIVVYCVNPADGALCRRMELTETERAYRPALASDGRNLFLAYESFFAERYHVMVRVLQDSGRSFSEGVEAGCDMVNDNCVSLFADEGGCYLTWENSSPLFDDYVWAPPEVERPVLMPSYGHGWRVYSKIMLRRISVSDGVLTVSVPDACGDRNTPVPVEATEDAGEACCFVSGRRLFLVFTEYADRVHYQAIITCWNGEKFEKLNHPVIDLYDRKRPVFGMDGDDLVVLGEDDSFCRSAFRIPLQDVSGTVPGFHADKCVKLNTLRGTSGYVPEIRRTAQVDGEELTLYWGDLHMHSNISHCSRHPAFHCSNVEIKNRYSRDAGGLDFCLLTDHDSMCDLEWARTVKNADFTNMDGSFSAFIGYEWTSTQKTKYHNYGHYNVLYRHNGPMLAIDNGICPDVEQLWATMQPGEALTIPHHPGELVHPLDWNYFSEEFVRLVEIYQVRGSYEYDHCDFDPVDYGRGITPNNSVRTGLNRGYHFGFTAGGEHEGVGITGVFAKTLTRDGIFEALYHRRTYGTTSTRLYATMFADSWFMGSDIPEKRETVRLSGVVNGTDDICRLTAVTDLGETEIMDGYCPETGSYSATCSVDGAKWLYLRVKQADGNIAWTSPVFFA